METRPTSPLLVIVGPTASGKSELALRIAKKCDGEIICADSKTIYKGMDIGTAKPSRQDQEHTPHHLLDIQEPGQYFSVFDFKLKAIAIIADIRSRHRLPILVGGTGLYIDSVVFDYQFPPKPNKQKQQYLSTQTLDQLYVYCKNNNISLPYNYKNKRHVITQILNGGTKHQRRQAIVDNTVIVGITTNTLILKQRIMQRTEHMFSHGVVKEAKILAKNYGWDNEAMTGNIYPIIQRLVRGEITMNEAMELNNTQDWQLAKRQMTWFKRNPYIHWTPIEEARSYLIEHIKSAKLANK